MYIQRILEKKLQKYIDKKEILAIVGARQCGKTTIMKQILNRLKNAKFISFEDREILELFSQDIKAFVEIYVKGFSYLFIDEFQYAKQGGKQLKYIFDSFNIKIIISGSSASELSIQSIKYLVGRIFVFNLYPLNFEEYLMYKDEKLFNFYLNSKKSKIIIEKINKLYEEFTIYGGYPRVVISENKEEKKEVLKNIYNTYFLKEIKEILQISDDFKLSKLIKILAIQSGGIINYNELSSATGFDFKELLKSINILQKTFICIESRPFFTNKKKEIIKSPKIFFLDNGFRNCVIKNFQQLNDRVDKGALNENFIASEIIKKEIEIKFWRTKAKAEVDFILESGNEKTPLEVKSKRETLTKSLQSFLDAYKTKKAFVLLQTTNTKTKKFKNTQVYFRNLFEIRNILDKI